VAELAANARFYASRPQHPLADAKAAKMLSGDALTLLEETAVASTALSDWSVPAIESMVREIADKHDVGLGKVAQPLRVSLTGSTASPSIFEVMEVLGKEETIARIEAVPKDSA
jgi:glutamyl-tRNA synthetase